MEELLDDDDGSIATYGAEIHEKCNRLSELATELKVEVNMRVSLEC